MLLCLTVMGALCIWRMYRHILKSRLAEFVDIETHSTFEVSSPRLANCPGAGFGTKDFYIDSYVEEIKVCRICAPIESHSWLGPSVLRTTGGLGFLTVMVHDD